MAQKTLSIAIIGAGMGGIAAAATLRQCGIDVNVYEQAHQFARIGAGIQMLPNSSRVLREIGVEQQLRDIAFQPFSISTGFGIPARSSANCRCRRALYGAPFLCMHRADLHAALYIRSCRPRSFRLETRSSSD